MRNKNAQLNEIDKKKMDKALMVILLYFAQKRLATFSSNIELDEDLWLVIYVFLAKAQNLQIMMLYSKNIYGVLPLLDMLHKNPNLNEVYIKVNNPPI